MLWRLPTREQSFSSASSADPIYITNVLLQATISTTHRCFMLQDPHPCSQSSFCCSLPRPLPPLPSRLALEKYDTTLLSPTDLVLCALITIERHRYPTLYVLSMRTYTSPRGRAVTLEKGTQCATLALKHYSAHHPPRALFNTTSALCVENYFKLRTSRLIQPASALKHTC